jgi:UDP-2,3-diacylglucosamine pyrophosphatase LpxH
LQYIKTYDIIFIGGEEMNKKGKYLMLKQESVNFLNNYKRDNGVAHGNLVDLALDTFRLREVCVFEMTEAEAKTMLRSSKIRLDILKDLITQLELRLED